MIDAIPAMQVYNGDALFISSVPSAAARPLSLSLPAMETASPAAFRIEIDTYIPSMSGDMSVDKSMDADVVFLSRIFLAGIALGIVGFVFAVISPSSFTYGVATSGAILATVSLVAGKSKAEAE